MRPTTAFQQLCRLASCCSAGGYVCYSAQIILHVGVAQSIQICFIYIHILVLFGVWGDFAYVRGSGSDGAHRALMDANLRHGGAVMGFTSPGTCAAKLSTMSSNKEGSPGAWMPQRIFKTQGAAYRVKIMSLANEFFSVCMCICLRICSLLMLAPHKGDARSLISS